MAREVTVQAVPNASAALLPKSVRSDLLADAAVEARNIATGVVDERALSVSVLTEIRSNTTGLAALREQLAAVSETVAASDDTVTIAGIQEALATLRALVNIALEQEGTSDEDIRALIAQYLVDNPIEGVTNVEFDALAARVAALEGAGSGDDEPAEGEADGVVSSVTATRSGQTVTITLTRTRGASLSDSFTLPTIALTDAQIEQIADEVEIPDAGITLAQADARYLRTAPPFTTYQTAVDNRISTWARVGNVARIPSNKIYGTGQSFASTANAWLTKSVLYTKLKDILS